MALAKQTLILILISAHIILATCKDAHSTPLATPDAKPTKPDTKKETKKAPLPTPDVKPTKPDTKKDTKKETKKDSKKETEKDTKKDTKKETKKDTKKGTKKETKKDTKKETKKDEKETKKDEKETKPSNPSEFSFPDIKEATDKAKAVTKPEVANVVSKQMQAVQKTIDEFNASLKKRLDNPKSSPGSKECVSECDEVFGAAIDDIMKTLDSLESQNLVKANFDISAVATNVDTCNDCFNEMSGGDQEVKKLGDWVRKITGDALEALQKATS
uniref:cylicin-1-like n=1 Tax=Erigeron canadensis TaxID=72917 RepID=UPI001CB945A0|nr:cylicin-1-like [Erigeron canadensis]